MNKIIMGCLVIFLILSLGQNEDSFILSANKTDIRSETIKYKKLFAETTNTKYISRYLESYIIYWHNTLSILNDAFRIDDKLYKLVVKYGIFNNYKVSLQRGKNNLIDNLGSYLDEYGIKIGYSEDYLYLYLDPIYIANELNNVLPKNIIEYFILESIDINEGFEEDEGLIIPWDILRTKILRYDAYLDKISCIDCPFITKSTIEKIYKYLNVYFKGLPNSGIDECIKDAKTSYEKYIKGNKESKYYDMIKKYYHDLERNKFQFRYKEQIKNGRAIETPIIFDVSNKETSIFEVADKYLNEIKKGYFDIIIK